MHGFQSLGDLQRQLNGCLDRDRPLLDPVRQRRACDQFENEAVLPIGLF